MTGKEETGIFTLYSAVEATAVRWLWYRLAGKSFLEQNLVSFPISDAIPIENGKMLDEAVSPTVAPRRTEASPSQNILVRQ